MERQNGENQFGKVSGVTLKAAACQGKTILEDVSFTAPYKIMKPFQKPDGGIQVMPLCASAGIMRGDVQQFDYEVCEGADLELLSQSFEKIHKMDGGSATRDIQVRVEKNARLSYFPQPVIPFAGSAFDSTMEIRLEDESSQLFLMDILSCGRAASGERFGYRRFSSKVMIWRGEELIYRDNCRYEPEVMPMEDLGMYEGFSHMANIFLTKAGGEAEAAGGDGGSSKSGNAVEICRNLQEEIWQILEAEEGCEGGVSQTASGDLAVRILGNRAQKLQDVAENIKKRWESK